MQTVYFHPQLATFLLDFINSEEFVLRIVLFSIFVCSAVISGNFFSCTIFCNTFSLALLLCLVFRFHVSKAHSIFLYICHERCVFVISFKKHRSLYSYGREKKALKSNRFTPCWLRKNMQWHNSFSLSMVYWSWIKVGRRHYFSSLFFYDNFFWIDSLKFSLLSIIQTIIQSEKFKVLFHSERPYNSENETENTVRDGENHTRISLISLTRLTLSKYYITLDIYSCKHQ